MDVANLKFVLEKLGRKLDKLGRKTWKHQNKLARVV